MKRRPKNLPFLSSFIAGLFFIVGMIIGVTINPLLFGISIISILVPDILRELGLLGDMDEFQLAASRRAGQHAYIFAGLFIGMILVFLYGGFITEVHSWEIFALTLLLIFVVKYTSYFFQFWDKRKAAFRLLIIIGIFWLVFVLLSGVVKEKGISAVLFVEILAFPLAFIILAITSLKIPKISGVVCFLLAAISMTLFFYRFKSVTVKLHLSYFAFFSLITLPLVIAGLSLLTITKDRGGVKK